MESGKENLYNLNQNLISDRQVLINENERLKDEVKVRQGFIEDYKIVCDKKDKENQQLKDRIAELEKEVETRKEEVLHLQEYGKKLIRETELKQFAERLKEHPTMKIYSLHNACERIPKAIDETLKEYENEKRNN